MQDAICAASKPIFFCLEKYVSSCVPSDSFSEEMANGVDSWAAAMGVDNSCDLVRHARAVRESSG